MSVSPMAIGLAICVATRFCLRFVPPGRGVFLSYCGITDFDVESTNQQLVEPTSRLNLSNGTW